MQSFTLTSPAKINRFLHIIGRRADGYHLLQTLFQCLDFGDTMAFTLNATPEINVQMFFPNGQDCGIPVTENLVYKLSSYLQEKYKIGSGINIKITKRIPMGGGLGGGSSNAATTLLALNCVWELNLDRSTLMAIGAQFGADIPFFLQESTAWGEGIGTELTPTHYPEKYAVVLVPNCFVSTIKMYQHPQLTRDSTPFRIDTLEGLLKNGQFESVVRNDFESLARELYPEIATHLDWLDQYSQARLSGSGACLFASFDAENEAKKILNLLPSGYNGFVAKCINQSPVHTQLREFGFLI